MYVLVYVSIYTSIEEIYVLNYHLICTMTSYYPAGGNYKVVVVFHIVIILEKKFLI